MINITYIFTRKIYFFQFQSLLQTVHLIHPCFKKLSSKIIFSSQLEGSETEVQQKFNSKILCYKDTQRKKLKRCVEKGILWKTQIVCL